MLKKRVIFTLLYDNGSFMLSRNFRLQKVGDLRWLKKNYNFSQIAFSIDELIILDVSRNKRNKEIFCEHVKALNEDCFIPIAAGGGIRDEYYAKKLLKSGADKVVLNSILDINPNVVSTIAENFGNQSIVVSVDVRRNNNDFEVWTDNGTKKLELSAGDWLKSMASLPIGEIYLNSIDRDGTGQGYLFDILDLLPNEIPMPIILAGGVGKYHHLLEGLKDERVDAVATAHLFNFVGNGLQNARKSLIKEGLSLPVWDHNVTVNLKQILSKY